MKLSQREFKAMNNPVRRLLQRRIEFPLFKGLGLSVEGLDVLEIGCGSGYGAYLLSEQRPRSYVGVDLMPEQIQLAQELAQEKGLAGYVFRVQDAADLASIGDESKDVIVIFGILHHITNWREVIQECCRVLRPGGQLYIEEPDGLSVERWDRLFHWGHPENARFRLSDLEAWLQECGFAILKHRMAFRFGYYAAQKSAREQRFP